MSVNSQTKLSKFLLIFLISLISANLSLAQTKVDLGKLRQNTYTNDFFELKVEFPFGWLVGDNELEGQLVAIQKSMVRTKSPKDQAALTKAMARVTPLLGGYKALPGSVTENSNLRIVVENLSAVPKIKTSQDYLSAMLSTIKLTKLPPDYFVSSIKNELIDEKMIDYLETKYLNSHKRSYVIIKKRFAVLITIDAYNQADFDALHQVLAEIDLDYKK